MAKCSNYPKLAKFLGLLQFLIIDQLKIVKKAIKKIYINT